MNKQEITEKLKTVEEFKVIRELAETQGIKAYLFGGSAAAFAHYVK